MNHGHRQLLAEAVGTALLLAAIVGSAVMADLLFTGHTGLTLLANALATGAMLTVLILVLGPVSGAHFNPVVTAVAALRGELTWRCAGLYMLCQLAGAIAGVWLAHAMFELPLLQAATAVRSGPGQWLSELVATAGMVLIIARRPTHPAPAVGLYIVAAYWFTASTSFANPAMTIARSLTATFSGIAISSVPVFIVAQALGGLCGLGLALLMREPRSAPVPRA